MTSAAALADAVRASPEPAVAARLRDAHNYAGRQGGDLLGVFQQETAAESFLRAVQVHARTSGTPVTAQQQLEAALVLASSETN
jgi:hypothetical protein